VPWLLLLAGVVGVILYVSLGQQSWPAAAVDMKLSRKDAETRSAEFLASIGCDVSRYTARPYSGHPPTN
jgi:hypothetical protein